LIRPALYFRLIKKNVNGTEKSEAMSTLMLEEPERWFAATVKPNMEKVATAALQDQGLEAFLPSYRVWRRWSDRVKGLDVPLFPGYTFCRFNPLHRVPVLSSPGIVSIVGFGPNPAAIDDHEIESVRNVIASGLPVQPWAFLETGEQILIEKGPLAGVFGTVQVLKESCRLVVSISLLQRSLSVELDRDCISGQRQWAGTTVFRPVSDQLGRRGQACRDAVQAR
jgi:transcriptional antiterminator NusG